MDGAYALVRRLVCLCSYEIHFSTRKSYAPSVVMEQLIVDTRSGAVVNVGLVIDATGSDTFLHDVKCVASGVDNKDKRVGEVTVRAVVYGLVGSGTTGTWST